jgi:peptidoglycan glycosyltransferase
VESVAVGNDITYRANPGLGERFMSRQTAKTLKELMRKNVELKYGADHFPELNVCAKSGTAETGTDQTNALFAGFVDDERYPLAFIVVVEEGGFGSKTCVPIAAEVLSACKDMMDGL